MGLYKLLFRREKKKKKEAVGVSWKASEAFKAVELGLHTRIKECPFVPTHLLLRHEELGFF